MFRSTLCNKLRYSVTNCPSWFTRMRSRMFCHARMSDLWITLGNLKTNFNLNSVLWFCLVLDSCIQSLRGLIQPVSCMNLCGCKVRTMSSCACFPIYRAHMWGYLEWEVQYVWYFLGKDSLAAKKFFKDRILHTLAVSYPIWPCRVIANV